MDGSSLIGLVGFLVACFAAASSGAIFRPGDWYEGLSKPWWRPPNWLFGPVWAILFVMIAVSGWMVWREAGTAAAVPLAIYALQLVLNALWSAIFFGMRRMGLAAIEMAVLWIAIVATMVTFYPIRAEAAWLLGPYLFWVSFAFFLNVAVWRRNPAVSV